LKTCSSVTLLLVVTLTSTAFTFAVTMCFINRLNLYYYHKFSMKHYMHLNKLWTICHFMSIQTTYVTCIWRCLFVFFDLVVLLVWLPPWSTLSSFCMSPHYDLSSHNLCNVFQSSLY
jgi:hypothetical protein